MAKSVFEKRYICLDIIPFLFLSFFRLIHDDKKSAETACLALSRLAESYKNDKAKLKDIAKAGVLTNLQKILATGGGTVSSQTFVTVMHILVVMSSHGSEVGPLLLKENIGPTLRTLLVQEPKNNNTRYVLIQKESCRRLFFVRSSYFVTK